MPLAGNQIDVTDEFGAALAPFQHNLTAMERLQLDAMGDADDGRPGQLFGDDLHHFVLALFVERGGGFVQYDDIRVVQQQTGKRQPLLFTA